MEDDGVIKVASHMKVLISDESKDFYSQCAAIFNAYNYDTVYAPKDGKIVCDMIREHNPDVVLMEAFMPHKDAVVVMKEVTADSIRPAPLFMTVSSFGTSTLERELTAAGASYFFLKPVEADIVAERIMDIAENRKKIQWNNSSVRRDKSQPDLKVLVTDIIHQIGVPAHIKGYHYLRDSIILAIEQPEIINSVTKQLYPEVAMQHHTTSSRVERAIRHAIEVAWDRGDVDVLNSYFGYTIHNGRGKPTNSEFIAMISDKLTLKLRMPANF